MIKSAICLSAFYLIYILTLSKDTLYSRNRIYLLISSMLSLVLPFIVIETSRPIDIKFFGKVLSEVFVYSSGEPNGIQVPAESKITGMQIINSVYVSGLLFFGLKFFINLLELTFLIIRKRTSFTNIIKFNGYDTSGFSALGYIFINSGLSPDEEHEIIRHEQNHLDKYHFIDIVFIEIIKIFQWFNPAIHMADRSLRAIHEFQADEGCLKKGIAILNYQQLLMNQVFNSKIFGLKNCFSNPRLIKKRMIMMTRQRSNSLANLKLLLVLPVVIFVLAAFSSSSEKLQSGLSGEKNSFPGVTAPSGSLNGINLPQILPPPPEQIKVRPAPKEKNQISSDNFSTSEPFVVVEEMPLYPGGPEALLKHIAENVIYPETAKQNNLQGRVIVRFVVTAEGKAGGASVLKGVSPELDNEAIRVVNSLPEFKPGRQGGKPVPVWYMVPITFTLK